MYYNGKMDEETLKSKGWEPDPFNGLKILKGEMEHYYDSDPEIQRSEEKIAYLKTTIDTLNEIVNNLNWRHQTISNMIRFLSVFGGIIMKYIVIGGHHCGYCTQAKIS